MAGIVRSRRRLDPFSIFGLGDPFGLDWEAWPRNRRDGRERMAWRPRVDVTETDHDFTVDAEMPGLRREDIHVTFKENLLTITGERKHVDEQEDKSFYRQERSYGKFSRSFRLGTEIETEKITASYKDGILTLVLPKVESAKPRQIDVNVM